MPSLAEETNGTIKQLMPGATIGIIGGGQLGQMMAISAKYHGFRVGTLDPTPNCPCAQVADFQITADYDDEAAIRELARRSDVLTYEFENVDADAIDTVRGTGADKAAVPQGTDLLRVTQERVHEKTFINSHGTPTAPWRPIDNIEELADALEGGYGEAEDNENMHATPSSKTDEGASNDQASAAGAKYGAPATTTPAAAALTGANSKNTATSVSATSAPSIAPVDCRRRHIGYPAVLKTRSGGYDGHGQDVLRGPEDLQRIRERAEREGTFPPSILEGFVDFDFEASVLVSGNGNNDELVTFPLVRNEHRNNILHLTIAPAQVSPQIAQEAHDLAVRLARGFELAGTLAIELFITKDGRVIVNELAPRPHNSGHYTIEACSLNQYDAHIRGIAGWPLPPVKLLSPAVMANVLGQHVAPTRALIGEHPEWNVHDYGKAEVRQDRKMGHITVLTDDTSRTVHELEATGCWDDLKSKH